MNMTDKPHRLPEYDIDPVFTNRWSPRSFTGEPVSDPQLFSLFEAARWAPSANNSQPWRFIYAKNGSEHWSRFLQLANENNQRWAAKAGALVALVSKKTHLRQGDTEPSALRNHSLDAGAAWASLAFQAVHAGLSTHAIGGFDREKARQILGVPDDYHIEILIAVGKRAGLETLDADLHERERPTPRRPLKDFLAEGVFQFNA